MKNLKKTAWIRGLSTVFSFLGAFFLCAGTLVESNDMLVNIIDSFLGGGKTMGSTNAEAFMFTSDFEDTKSLLQHRKELGIQYSEEGSVLLKNNGSLPLRSNPSIKDELKVTVLGTRAYTYRTDGSLRDEGKKGATPWTYSVYGGICGSRIWGQNVTLPTGTEKTPWTLTDALNLQNIKVNPTCARAYDGKRFTDIPSGGEASGTSSEAFNSYEPSITKTEIGEGYNDAAIVFIGRSSGEGRDYLPGENGVKENDGSKSALHLNDNERNLIQLASEVSDKVIVLLNSAVTMEIDELKNDSRVDSILWIGLPGAYGMIGVAEIIAGTVNPSGQLSDTYASDASKAPAAINFGYGSQSGQPFLWADRANNQAWNGHYVVLAEGIYDGYYYYETRYNDCVEGRGNASNNKGVGRYGASSWNYGKEVTYPFGYGLSYTTFTEEFVNNGDDTIRYDSEDNSLNFSVKVTNTGSVAGKHAVQLYASTPYTNYDVEHNVEKPAIELKDFAKTQILEPGESETLDLKVELKYLASYDQTLVHDGVVGGYILDEGNYYFSIGNGAHEALNSVLLKKDENNEGRLIVNVGEVANANKALLWNPTGKINGSFSNGINSSLSISETGEVISNQLQNSDYNYYKPGTITYLTRNDWTTFPDAYPNLEATAEMKKRLGSNSCSGHEYVSSSSGKVDVEWGVDHTIDEDDEGNPLENLKIADLKGSSFEDEQWDYLLEEIKFNEAYTFNPEGGSYCNEFLSIGAPKVWQVDGPNGYTNYGLGTKSPASGIMSIAKGDPNYDFLTSDMCIEGIKAATFNKDLLLEEGKAFGENSMWARTPIGWAPGMNLHRSTWNSRNHEYYSEDPILTNKLGAAFVLGGLEKGAILSPKHFAFNTQEGFREGLAQFMTEQAARQMDLRAFQGAIEDITYTNALGNTIRGSLGLMTSFSRLGVTDVNNHTGLMKNILRKEWGFKGLSSTDYVSGTYYFNPLDCVINNVTFMASNDGKNSLLKPEWSDYADSSKLAKDATFNTALKENMHYYLYAIANSSALNGYDAKTVIADSKELLGWQKAIYAVAIAGFSIGAIGFGLYGFFSVKKNLRSKKEENNDEE